MKECHICYEKCIVPVQMKCFDCYDTVKMNCNSLQRVCLTCYVKGNFKKCTICRAEKVNDEIEIDFDSIHNDSMSIYTCPLCDTFEGSHYDLYQHMMNTCLFFCECGSWVVKKNTKEHYQGSCSVFRWCQKCQKPVKKCKHIPCSRCGKHCPSEHHCSYETVECSDCHEKIPFHELVNHFLKHVEQSKQKVMFLKSILTQERKRYHRLLKTIPDVYNDVYDESFVIDES